MGRRTCSRNVQYICCAYGVVFGSWIGYNELGIGLATYNG